MHNIGTRLCIRIGIEMRISIEVTEGLMSELMTLLKTRNRKEAVRIALEEFVRCKKIERLLALPGEIDILDTSKELEYSELFESLDKG